VNAVKPGYACARIPYSLPGRRSITGHYKQMSER